MTNVAIQTRFGSLVSYTYPASYDKNKLGLGPLMVQSNGTGENGWVGPFPVCAARPAETIAAIFPAFTFAINWSSTYDWVFVGDATAASVTRRFQLYRFNKTNITNPWSWIGYVTCMAPFAGTQGLSSRSPFVVSYEKYTTGTVSINNGSSSLIGSGTSWKTDRMFVGSRIGFGSTDPSDITVWYEIGAIDSDTSITLTQNFTDINISLASYVIEDLRLLWCCINGTTLTNSGLFMAAGLRYENFISTGTTLPAATNMDKVRAVYWLSDGNATSNSTNQNYNGLAIDAKTSWTNQRVYAGDFAANVVRLQVNNFRAAMTVGGTTAGRDSITSTFLYNTGQQSMTGTMNPSNGSLVICTPSHGPRSGIKSLFWTTTTRFYSAEVAGITSGSTNFISGVATEVPPGGTNTYPAIGALCSLAYDSLTDRFFIGSLGTRCYLTQYREDGGPWDRNVIINIGQLTQTTADSTAPAWPNGLGVGVTGCILNGMGYFTSPGVVATISPLHNMPFGADWEYASSTNCRIVLPVMDTTKFTQFVAGFVSPIEVIGGRTGTNLGIEPSAVRLHYRTSGINDNTGSWTLLDYTGDMSQIPASVEIQGMMEFRTATIQAIPAKVTRAGFIGTSINSFLPSDKHFQLSQKHTDIGNKQFVFRYSQNFGTTVPTLYLRIYDGVNSNLLISDDSVTQAGTWEKSVDDGANWTLFNTSDRGNEITYLRFTPASIADNIEALPTVRLS